MKLKMIYWRGEFAPFIYHCATVQVWFTPLESFFSTHYLLEMRISLTLINQRFIESESRDTWESFYMGKTFHLQQLQLD